MDEQHEIEKQLKAEAKRISEQMGGAPVVIVAPREKQYTNGARDEHLFHHLARNHSGEHKKQSENLH